MLSIFDVLINLYYFKLRVCLFMCERCCTVLCNENVVVNRRFRGRDAIILNIIVHLMEVRFSESPAQSTTQALSTHEKK